MKRITFILLITVSFNSHAEYGKTWADFASELLTGKITSSSGTTDLNTLFSNDHNNSQEPKWCNSNKLEISERIVCSTKELWLLEDRNLSLYREIYDIKTKRKANEKERDAWVEYKDKYCTTPESCKKNI